MRSSNREENPESRASRRSCRVVHANIRSMYKNLLDLSLLARGGFVIFFVQRLLSLLGATFPSLWVRVLADRCSGSGVRLIGLDGLTVYERDGFSAYRQRGYECGCCEVMVVRIVRSSHNFYAFGVYRNPDLSDKIFDCLLTTMAKVKSVDRTEKKNKIFDCLLTTMAKVQSVDRTFLFIVTYLNAHHEEWLGSSTPNFHGRAARDFSSSSGCE